MNAEKYKKKRENGLCVNCGANSPHRSRCSHCARLKNMDNADYYRRLREREHNQKRRTIPVADIRSLVGNLI